MHKLVTWFIWWSIRPIQSHLTHFSLFEVLLSMHGVKTRICTAWKRPWSTQVTFGSICWLQRPRASLAILMYSCTNCHCHCYASRQCVAEPRFRPALGKGPGKHIRAPLLRHGVFEISNRRYNFFLDLKAPTAVFIMYSGSQPSHVPISHLLGLLRPN